MVNALGWRGEMGGRVLVIALGLFSARCSDDLRRWNSRPPVKLLTDADGAIVENELGIRGHWYAFGDDNDVPATCSQIGKHADCAQIVSPDPMDVSTPPHFRTFSPEAKGMCLRAKIEKVEDCCAGWSEGKCHDVASVCNVTKAGDRRDYGNMWGAGIGFDFNATLQDREAWNADKVQGVSFELDIEGSAASSVRVAFPLLLKNDESLPRGQGAVMRDGTVILADGSVLLPGGARADKAVPLPDGRILQPNGVDSLPARSTTEEYPGGSPFWTDDAANWSSPVRPGQNEIPWGQISPPADATYVFDKQQLLGIQFHVTPDAEAAKGNVTLCVKDFALLR